MKRQLRSFNRMCGFQDAEEPFLHVPINCYFCFTGMSMERNDFREMVFSLIVHIAHELNAMWC